MNKPVTVLQIPILLSFLFLIIIILLSPQSVQAGPGVYILDVGQGDSFLVQTENGAQVLIDGGKDADVLMKLSDVMPRGDKHIDVIIATHPDADHIGGLPYVLSQYTTSLFLTTAATAETEIFTNLYNELEEKNIQTLYARTGMKLHLDTNVVLSILFPDRDTHGWETNTASIITRLDMGESSMLFTGDAPESIEKFLAGIKSNLDVDVLKLGHHGSKTSSSEEFLSATSPEIGVISAGRDNSYGHPHEEVVKRAQVQGVRLVNTAELGTMRFVPVDGRWRLQKEQGQ